MAVDYKIPPWIAQGADPAAQYAQGLGIGVRIGAERAQQQYAQQQLLRQQAKDEFDRQYQQAKLQFDVDRVMRVQQAQAGFQQAVQSGMDPSQALMQFGPAMGDSAASIIQAQEMAEFRQQQLDQQKAYQAQNAPGTTQPEAKVITDPTTGKPITMVRTGPNAWREPRGEGETIEFTSPGGETMRIARGGAKGAAGVPTAMVTKTEESIAGAVNAAKLGATLLNRLRPEDIGVLGRGGEIIIDESLAQVIPSAANLERVNSRSLLRLFRNDFTRALKFDSQLSNEERQRIEALLPGEGSRESLPAALQKIRTATKEAAERARFSAERSQRPVPKELLKPSELMEMVKRGELTPQQASALAKMSPYRDEFDALLKR